MPRLHQCPQRYGTRSRATKREDRGRQFAHGLFERFDIFPGQVARCDRQVADPEPVARGGRHDVFVRRLIVGFVIRPVDDDCAETPGSGDADVLRGDLRRHGQIRGERFDIQCSAPVSRYNALIGIFM